MNTLSSETPKQQLDSVRALAPMTERRRFPRVQLTAPLPAVVGRTDVMIVDLSARGVRVLHTSVFPRAEEFRFALRLGNMEHAATAKIVSSRVVRAGSESTLPLYETRFALVHVPNVTEYALARLLPRLANAGVVQPATPRTTSSAQAQ